MASIKRTSIGEILLSCRTRLTAFSTPAIETSRVFIAARTDVPHFQAMQDVVLVPGSFSIDESRFAGGGKWDTAFHRTIHVVIRTQMWLDMADRDQIQLTDTSKGHYLLEEKVVDALHNFMPVDDSNNDLAIEPLMIRSGDDARKESIQDEWVNTKLSFEVFYYPPLTNLDEYE